MLSPFFLCWGSFLNVLAYRLVTNKNIAWPASHCTSCKKPIAWYDNIPLISFFVLHGTCRECKKPISKLYPFIEFLTLVSMSLLWVSVPVYYFTPYFIFFSALIVTIRSDLEFMLISRFVSLFLAPLGLFFSAFHFLPLSLPMSIIGALIGSLFLIALAYLFWGLTKKQGIGQGDIELMVFIGSFIGPIGCWFTLLAGSISGSLVGLIILLKVKKSIKMPFGPFLALAAMTFVLIQPYLHLFIDLN